MKYLVQLTMLVLLGVGILFPTQSLSAQSGLDLNNYCSSKGWGRAILVGNTAYDWKCEDSSGRLHDMDLNEACRMQYGSSYRAGYSNFNDANSWHCSSGNNSQSNNGSNNGNGNSGQSSPPASNSDNGGSTSSSQQSDCYAHAEPVSVGGRGQVTPGLSNRIRSWAGLGFEQVGTARPGTAFDVLSGPTCADGYWWWQIRYQGITGWTVEGTNGDNWIEAVSGQSTTSIIAESLGEPCVALSSATLATTSRVRACAESAFSGLPDRNLMVNFAVESVQCAVTGGTEFTVSLIRNLRDSWPDWRFAIATTVSVDTPQSVAECLVDVGSTLFE